MFSRRICYTITLLAVSFVATGCWGDSRGVSDPCKKDPKWYSNEKCPKGYLCGYGKAGSGQSSTAEFKAKSLARNDLSAALSQFTSRELRSAYQELEGDATREAYDKLFATDKFVTVVEAEITNSIVHEKIDAICDSKNWYWVSVKKDIDGIDFKSLFTEAVKDTKLSDSDRKFIEESMDWADDVLRNR